MRYKAKQITIGLRVLLALGNVLVVSNLPALQNKPDRASQSAVPSGIWNDNKVAVKVESPSLSESGNVVLAYTVTNKSGRDIDFDFAASPRVGFAVHDPIRVFLKLKDPPSFLQVKPRDDFLRFSQDLLPAGLPVIFDIVVPSSEGKPSWFSSESSDDRVRRLLHEKLANVDSIVAFVPDRHLKISFPIPTGAQK